MIKEIENLHRMSINELTNLRAQIDQMIQLKAPSLRVGMKCEVDSPRVVGMIGEIINAVEKNMDATQCSGEGICNGGSKCIAHNFWMDFNDNVNEFLMTRSLDDVISNRRGSVQLKDKVLIATG